MAAYTRIFKKIFVWSSNLSFGNKKRNFNEKEIREELYNIKINSPNISKSIEEKYRERIDNGLIEIENPAETLLNPYSISYWRRRIVAIPEGRELKIVDKEYIRKLAQKEGMPVDEFIERRLKKIPDEYLGYGIYNERLVYVKDVIGILPSKSSGLLHALAHKEGYLIMLAMKSDDIIRNSISRSSYTWRIY